MYGHRVHLNTLRVHTHTHTHTHISDNDTDAQALSPGPGSGAVPVVFTLFAVVLQVGDVVVISVGVVATSLAPNHTLDVSWRRRGVPAPVRLC